jgi:hypothetical protein
MRDDQYLKFKRLGEELIEVALAELEPANWSGAGLTLAELSKNQRGDRYWAKKNANQTLTLVIKMQSLAGMIERAQKGSTEQPELTPDGETVADELDAKIKAAERQAAQILKRAHSRANEPKH